MTLRTIAILIALFPALSIASGQTRPAASPGTAPADRNAFFAMDTCTKLTYPASDIPPAAQLDMLQSLGYAGISWTAEDPQQVKAVADLTEQRGLRMFAIYVIANLDKTGLRPDPRLKQIMEALKGHETVIWLQISSRDFAASSPEGDAVALEGLRKLADDAADCNLRIAIYPHVGAWAERVQDGVRLAQKVDRENFGVTFNLCHCLAVGDEDKIPALLEEALPYLFLVSINGADAGVAKPDWSQLIQALDKGTFDVSTVLRRLQQLNYRGPIGLQGFGMRGDRRQNLERSMAAWRNSAATTRP